LLHAAELNIGAPASGWVVPSRHPESQPVYRLYAQVVWYLHNYGSPTNVFNENGLSWQRTDRGFEAILKQFPDSLEAMNEAAYLAVLAGDPVAALKYFQLAKGQMDVTLWDDRDQYVKCYKWALGQ
jgi:hypothetical protein